MDRLFLALGALSALVSVAAGAFGAHALRSRLALGLFVVAWATQRWPGGAAAGAGWLFVAGTVLFSGSLYVLALTDVRAFGAVTPLGGLAFLVGWALLAYAAVRGT